MTPKSAAETRRFLSSDAGSEFINELQKSRPKIEIMGQGIDDSAVIRLASKAAGWEECVETIEYYIKPPKVEPPIGGFMDFSETKKESKK